MQLFTKLLGTLRRKGGRMKFVNEAKPQEPNKAYRNPSMGFYHYGKPSIHLFQWSRLFQAVVSQAGTWILQNRFHSSECGIYKCEGGCRIDGVGELVLGEDYCYFDMGRADPTMAPRMAELITDIVLKFDPMDPIESIIGTAAENAKCDKAKLHDTVMGSNVGGAFGGDALSDFFNYNPFGPIPEDKEYRRWVLVELTKKKTNEEVDQMYADKELGKELLSKLQQKFQEQKCWYSPLCCSPSRNNEGKLHFWINTGRSTQIDGSHTKEEIEKFLKSKDKIVDRSRA
jgi:hypothetical protein